MSGSVKSVLLAVLAFSCGDDHGAPAQGADQMTCDAERPAVAYRGRVGADSGEAVTSSARAPVPCSQLTGFASSETSLAVLKNGDVLVAPVITPDGTGILRSKDRADSWQVLLPGQLGGAQHARVQPYMYVDPASERVLFATTTGSASGGFALSLSDDGGSRWRAGKVGVGTADWIKILSGPPAASGFPSTLYASSPSPISTALADHQQVLRSLDGGESWQRIDNDQLSLHADENGCDSSEYVIYGGGAVGSDGSLYLGLRRCARLGIAITRDQGTSWTVRDLPEATLVPYEGLLSHFRLHNILVQEPLALDSAGNLYAVWNDERDVLKLAVSRDRAETWSKPVAVAPPGIAHTVFADIDVKAPGTIALAYYGSDDGGSTYNAYVSESLDGLAELPTFHGARLNPPAGEPLFGEGFDIGYSELLSMGDLMEIVRVAYAPNGDIWASFSKDMCPGMDRSHCSWLPEEHTNATYQLIMGRLQHR